MRALKVLVVVMGIMLVVGFAALVAVIAGRVSRSGSAPTPARAFTSAAIEIPRDAPIEAMAAGPDRIVLALILPGGSRQLLIIDMATGARLGTIELHAAP
jgi:Family of unknown function (DUF6476)